MLVWRMSSPGNHRYCVQPPIEISGCIQEWASTVLEETCTCVQTYTPRMSRGVCKHVHVYLHTYMYNHWFLWVALHNACGSQTGKFTQTLHHTAPVILLHFLSIQFSIMVCPAGLLEVNSGVTNKPDEFFSDISEFRRVNKEECIHDLLSGWVFWSGHQLGLQLWALLHIYSISLRST